MSTNHDAEQGVDLFRKPIDLDPELETELASEYAIANGRQPRGLTDHGLVRTTGWLQLGPHPVSSGLITTAICFLIALVTAIILLPTYPLASGLSILLLPATGYGTWYLITTRLAPASTAHNTDTITADQLHTGTWVRLHGTIGPVGHIADIQPEHNDPQSTEDHTDLVHVTFTGGTHIIWPRNHQLHITELHN